MNALFKFIVWVAVSQAALFSTLTYAQSSYQPESYCAPDSRLTIIDTQYYDFNGQPQSGTIEVLDTIAPAVKLIFNQLYAMKFPIYLMNAEQSFSIFTDHPNIHPPQLSEITKKLTPEEADNTVAFSCRPITHGTAASIHAYGAAIDLNPVENPYIGFNESGVVTDIIPSNGWLNINRMKYRYAKPVPIGRAEETIETFQNNGILYWGGFWNTPIDYMHFELKREDAELLLTMSKKDAGQYFGLYTQFYRECRNKFPEQYSRYEFQDLTDAIYHASNKRAVDIYKDDPSKLFKLAKYMSINKKDCLPVTGAKNIQGVHGD